MGGVGDGVSARSESLDGWTNQEATMKSFGECPICGGELIAKAVEKLLKGGSHTAALTVNADVCLKCGERLYSSETVRRFERIRQKLARQEVADFQPVGQTFQVA
jgi:YgiT-type zinc finger domain-containing protein